MYPLISDKIFATPPVSTNQGRDLLKSVNAQNPDSQKAIELKFQVESAPHLRELTQTDSHDALYQPVRCMPSPDGPACSASQLPPDLFLHELDRPIAASSCCHDPVKSRSFLAITAAALTTDLFQRPSLHALARTGSGQSRNGFRIFAPDWTLGKQCDPAAFELAA